MNLDEYRERMAAEHRAFTDKVMEMLGAYGRTQTVFTETLHGVDQHLRELHETQDELRRLILEQGAQLREQAAQLREQAAQLQALRARLDGGSA